MALPTSGTITLAMIAAELGVGLPLDLNAANVRALAGKPSGNIIMPNDFYGKSSYDPYPDPVTFADLTVFEYGNASGTSSATITGISSAITLRVSINNPPGVRKRIAISVGGSGVVNSIATSPMSWDLTVNNGQTVAITLTATATQNLSQYWQGSCVITNQTTSGDTLGTFAFDLQALSDNGTIS